MDDERRDEENENALQHELAILRERMAETGEPSEDIDLVALHERIA